MKDHLLADSIFLDFGERKILRGASLRIERGKATGILGRNGTGKSCLMKILTGQLQPQHKYISYNGQCITNVLKRKGLVNYLPQHEFHPASLSLRQLLWYYSIPSEAFTNTYPFAPELMDKRFSDCSGGWRRLIEILLVLESDSAFSLLDEPFTHLMPLHIDTVKAAMARAKERKGILLADHQYRSVLAVSEVLYLLREGTLMPVSSEDDLREKGYIL